MTHLTLGVLGAMQATLADGQTVFILLPAIGG